MGSQPGRRLSVIVPVYNRVEELRHLLNSLGQQTFPRDQFEVLVCDDGSTEDLTPVVKEAAEQGLAVVHLRQENCGQAMAINLGLAHAQGDVVVTTDSDCVPDPGWLAALDRAFVDPGVGLAGGPVEYRGARHLSGRCIGFLMASMLGAAGATNPRCLVHMEYYPCAGNLAVRRGLAHIVGGFAARNDAGSRSGACYREDTDFSREISRLGIRPRFIPEAMVLHNERSSLWRILRENFRKGTCKSRGPQGFRPGQLLPALPAGLVVYLLMLPLSMVFWPVAAPILFVPLVVYVLVLAILAVQGGVMIGEARAACVIPFYALAMHIGYGCGYLAARLGLVSG